MRKPCPERKTRFRRRNAPADDDIASLLHTLADALLTDDGSERTVHEALVFLVSSLADADMASVTTVETDGRAEPTAYTDERAHAIDLAQYRTQGGPWVEVLRAGTVAQAVLTEVRTHWPEFVRCAREAQVRSFLSAPLVHRERVRATLNLYSYSRMLGDFDAERIRPFIAVPRARGHPCGGAPRGQRRRTDQEER
ncbi:GAF domain-containing protein [Haloactinomyces albus]|uniref:GAF domain-containing protein n=1 Tax=Haloactinomyces albus TaxID=1352928 RepID=A0AAE3ZB29_9ACTN|nr:GAF domain-containing protein [Haloactinomyces albus]MDR7300244.1 GAF domain-containing protein [Haloactinomyces albus]